MAKSFKDKIQEKSKAPEAMRYITTPQPPIVEPESKAEKETEHATAPTAPHKAAHQARRSIPAYEETKSRRLQLLITPSLHEAIKARAAEERRSVNDYINTVLMEAIGK